MKIEKKLLSIILLIVLITVLVPVKAWAQMPQGQQIIVKEMVEVNEVGDIHLEMTYSYPANYYTTTIAPAKINPFLIPEIRYLRSGQSPKEIPRDSVKVEFDDANSSVKVACDAMGFTRNMGDYWELEATTGATLTSQTGTSIVLTSTVQDANNTYLYTTTINFPKGTKEIQFNPDTGRIKYTLPSKDPSGFPVIWWVVIAIAICAVLAGAYMIARKRSAS